MENRRTQIITAGVMILIIAAVLTGIFIERNRNKMTAVFTSVKNNRTVKIFMVGEPDEPYGETTCRIDLYENGIKEEEQAISIQNEGEAVTAENFDVEWEEDCVSIMVLGLDQEEKELKISY